MNTEAVACPNCGAPLDVPEDKTSAKCEFCGSQVTVGEKKRGDIANWFELARTAKDGNNYQEAHGYYSKILEANPRSYKAWLGKAEAAGWMSTLANFRMSETLAAIDKAIEYAPEDKKDDVSKKVTDIITTLSVAFYRLAGKHLEEFISVEGAWAEYLAHCDNIVAALEIAHSLSPQDEAVMKNIVMICTDNISGRTHAVHSSTHLGGMAERVLGLSEEYKKSVMEKMEQYVNKLKQIDSSYQGPQFKKVGVSGCFIATATMGDCGHPYVVSLREYRDTSLLKKTGGRFFVKHYYRLSPYVANIIRRNQFLRRLTFFLVVRPLARFCESILLRKDRL